MPSAMDRMPAAVSSLRYRWIVSKGSGASMAPSAAPTTAAAARRCGTTARTRRAASRHPELVASPKKALRQRGEGIRDLTGEAVQRGPAAPLHQSLRLLEDPGPVRAVVRHAGNEHPHGGAGRVQRVGLELDGLDGQRACALDVLLRLKQPGPDGPDPGLERRVLRAEHRTRRGGTIFTRDAVGEDLAGLAAIDHPVAVEIGFGIALAPLVNPPPTEGFQALIEFSWDGLIGGGPVSVAAAG